VLIRLLMNLSFRVSPYLFLASALIAPVALRSAPLVQSSVSVTLTVPSLFLGETGAHTWVSDNAETALFSENQVTSPFLGLALSTSSSSALPNISATSNATLTPNLNGTSTLNLSATSTLFAFPLGLTGNISAAANAFAFQGFSSPTHIPISVAQSGFYAISGTYTVSVATPVPPVGIQTFGESFVSINLTNSQHQSVAPFLGGEINSQMFPPTTTSTHNFSTAYFLTANQNYSFEINAATSVLASTNGIPDGGTTAGMLALGFCALLSVRRRSRTV
jgi:hypothetical protein